jgi:DNA-binding transcriptional LysR family regulator
MKRLVDPRFDWRLLQTFLDVVECGSFRSASQERRVALNTVRSRVDQLEGRLRRKLLKRSVGGVTVTEAGKGVLFVVNAMKAAKEDAVSKLTDVD